MEVRLDKWLWAARFYKTRQKAIEAIKGGKVHINGQRTKPSKTVLVEDRIDLSLRNFQKTIIVKAISRERKGAKLACELFEETQESIKAGHEAHALRKLSRYSETAIRPSKKQRRQIKNFKEAQVN